MTRRTVTTQQALDDALADASITEIVINSPAGVWLAIDKFDSATVRATGSATVEAYGSATVRATGSATVWASGSATVLAYDSATVWAYDSATVRAYGSATVEASGSATVRAYGSATVWAYDSATVRAYGSATVRAYDSATVRAYGSATVEASKFVAVHLHHATASVTGGVLIDLTALDFTDPRTWCEAAGADIADDDTVTLYKAVDGNFDAGHDYKLTNYQPGATVTAPDWRDDHLCGGGLHLGVTPHHARRYFPGPARFVAVRVNLSDIRPVGGGIADKCKVPSCVVLHEVDEWCRPVADVSA